MNRKNFVFKFMVFILGVCLFSCQGNEYLSGEQSREYQVKQPVLTDAQIETLKKNEKKINKMLSFEDGKFVFSAKSGSEVGLDDHLFQYCLNRVEERNQLIANMEEQGYVAVEVKKNCVTLTRADTQIQSMRNIIINREFSIEVHLGGIDGVCLTDINITDVYLSDETMKNIREISNIPKWIPYSIASDLAHKMDFAGKYGQGIVFWFDEHSPCMHICEKYMGCTYEKKNAGDTIWLTYEM